MLISILQVFDRYYHQSFTMKFTTTISIVLITSMVSAAPLAQPKNKRAIDLGTCSDASIVFADGLDGRKGTIPQLIPTKQPLTTNRIFLPTSRSRQLQPRISPEHRHHYRLHLQPTRKLLQSSRSKCNSLPGGCCRGRQSEGSSSSRRFQCCRWWEQSCSSTCTGARSGYDIW